MGPLTTQTIIGVKKKKAEKWTRHIRALKGALHRARLLLPVVRISLVNKVP